MSVVLRSSATCRRCGETIPTGTRTQKLGGGYAHQSCQPQPRPVSVETTEAEPRATEKQVAYALACNAVVGPGERYTVEQLRAMSRAEISQVITLRSDLL